jgi:hypothetical protein
VFLAHQGEGAVQSATWAVGRPRRAWAPASTAARPLVGRPDGDAWRARTGGAGRCGASGRVHGARTGGPRPVSACGTAVDGRPAWHPCRDAARVGARSGAGSVGPIPLRPLQLRISPIFLTEVVQAVNSKVVDLPILYNFCKVHMAFFSTICAQIACQVADFLGAGE